jgi:hypothetical protein
MQQRMRDQLRPFAIPHHVAASHGELKFPAVRFDSVDPGSWPDAAASCDNVEVRKLTNGVPGPVAVRLNDVVLRAPSPLPEVSTAGRLNRRQN